MEPVQSFELRDALDIFLVNFLSNFMGDFLNALDLKKYKSLETLQIFQRCFKSASSKIKVASILFFLAFAVKKSHRPLSLQ